MSSENATLHEHKGILTDRDRLKEYVEKHYGGFNSLLFQVEFAVTTPLAIKPEYEVYIRRYGVPNMGIFDAEKMANIKRELGHEQNEYDIYFKRYGIPHDSKVDPVRLAAIQKELGV